MENKQQIKDTEQEVISSTYLSNHIEEKIDPNVNSSIPDLPLIEWNMIKEADYHEVAEKYQLLQFSLSEIQNYLDTAIRNLYKLFPVSPPLEKN